jgi:hypothetical protein
MQMTMAMLNEAVMRLSAPKRVIFDNDGNPVGIETVGVE